jgi:signal transduction histidine kinase
LEFLKRLISSDFLPHGTCYLWDPHIVWLHVISDSLITLAYYCIPLALVYLVRKRPDFPFNWIFWMFGLFILGCGTTHLMEVWTVWHGTYLLSGVVKAFTAAVSVVTAAMLIPLIPKAVALPGRGQLQAINQELEHQVARRSQREQELMQLTQDLETANKELEAFTYSVSHDLRAPLRHIAGFSKMLAEECGTSLQPEGLHYLQRIQDGTRRMGMLVDDLLNLARIGRHELRLQVTGLHSVVKDVIAELTPDMEGRLIEWKIRNLPHVEGDPALLRVVFQNLLSNALKYTRPRAKAIIEVGCEAMAGEQVVYVRDNGVGFNMIYADKLFGVFERLHRSEDFEGSGVGLATAQRIVQKHGGRIWAQAELDKGATFYMSFGKAKGAEIESEAAMAGDIS